MKFTYKNIEEIDKIYLHDWIFMGMMIYEREKCTFRMIVQRLFGKIRGNYFLQRWSI